MPTNIYKQAQAPSQTMGQPLQEETPTTQLEESGVIGIKPIGWTPEENIFRPARIEDVGISDEDFNDNIGGIYNGIIEGVAAVAAVPAFLGDLGSNEAEGSFIDAISTSLDKVRESDYHYTPYYKGQESEHSMNPFSEKFSSSYSLGELGHFLGFVIPTIAITAPAAPALAGAVGVGASAAILGGTTMLGMGYVSGYEAAKQAGLEGKHRLHFAQAYGAGMAILGTALPAGIGKALGGKGFSGMVPGLLPKSIMDKMQKGSIKEAVKAIRQFKGKGSDLQVINEMVLAAQKGNAKNIYKHLIKESGTFLRESSNSGAMLMGFTSYDYLTKAISDVFIDDIEQYKNTNKGKFGIEFDDVEDWKQGIKDTVTSGLFGFVGHGYNTMMKKGALGGAKAGYAARSGNTLSKYYKEQTKGIVGNEFDNIKALEIRSIVQRSLEKNPETGFRQLNTEKRDKLYKQYEAGIEDLVLSGKFTQEEAIAIKQNSFDMLQQFSANPKANTNAFMQGWRLNGLEKSLNNIVKQNLDILLPREGKKFNPNEALKIKFKEIDIEITDLKTVLQKKDGGALKGVEVERLETLIKSLADGREVGFGLPKNQADYLKGYLNDIIVGTSKISVIDGFKDIKNKDFVKRLSGYISSSKVANMYKDFSNKNISSRLMRSEKEFELETSKEIQEKLRSKDYNPVDALNYAKTPEQAKELLNVLLEDGRLIDSGFEFKEKLESDLRDQFDMDPKNLTEAIENVKTKIKNPELLYSDYKQSKLANLEGLDSRFQEIFESAKHAGLSKEQINEAANKFKELREDPEYLDDFAGNVPEEAHAGAEPVFNALDKAIKSINPEANLTYRQVSEIAGVMKEKGQLSEKAVQQIIDNRKGEPLEKKLTPEIIAEFDKIISNDLKETEAIFRTMHNKHSADIEAKKGLLKGFQKSKVNLTDMRKMSAKEFGKTYEDELSSFGYSPTELYDQTIIKEVLKNAKANNLSKGQIATQLGLESWLAKQSWSGTMREGFAREAMKGTKSERQILDELGKELFDIGKPKEAFKANRAALIEMNERLIVKLEAREDTTELKALIAETEEAIKQQTKQEGPKEPTPAEPKAEAKQELSKEDLKKQEAAGKKVDEIKAKIEAKRKEGKESSEKAAPTAETKEQPFSKTAESITQGGKIVSTSIGKKGVFKITSENENPKVGDTGKLYISTEGIPSKEKNRLQKSAIELLNSSAELEGGKAPSNISKEETWKTIETIEPGEITYYEKNGKIEAEITKKAVIRINEKKEVKESDSSKEAEDLIKLEEELRKAEDEYNAYGPKGQPAEKGKEGLEPKRFPKEIIPKLGDEVTLEFFFEKENKTVPSKVKIVEIKEVIQGESWTTNEKTKEKVKTDAGRINYELILETVKDKKRYDVTVDTDGYISQFHNKQTKKTFVGTDHVIPEFDLIKKESARPTAEAPKGIDKIFENNPDLAESIYEALGYYESRKTKFETPEEFEKRTGRKMRMKEYMKDLEPSLTEITEKQEQEAKQKYSQYLEQGGAKENIKEFKDFLSKPAEAPKESQVSTKFIEGGEQGKGTPEGDSKDKAMREVADGGIFEVAHNKPSSTQTSAKTIGIADQQGKTVFSTKNIAEAPKVVMLARNKELANKPLEENTKKTIDDRHSEGAEFVVGDMPGVDSRFVDYLNEIGAKYTVYHTDSKPRYQVTKEAPVAEAPKKPYEGNFFASDYFKEFEKDVFDALGIEENPLANLAVNAQQYLHKINNLTNHPELRKHIDKTIYRINDYVYKNKDIQQHNETNPTKAKNYIRLDKAKGEQLTENWKKIVEIIRNEPEILEDVKRVDRTIDKKIKEELGKEVYENDKKLGYYEFSEIKEKYNIREDSFSEAYKNMYDSGYHLYQENGQRAYAGSLNSLPLGKFLQNYRKYEVTSRIAFEKGFENAEQMLKFDARFPDLAYGKKHLESLGFGDSKSLGFMEPYTHLQRAVSYRKKEFIAEGLLKPGLPFVNLKNITSEIVNRTMFSLGTSAVLRNSIEMDPFLKGNNIQMFHKFEANQPAYKSYTQKYNIHFKLQETPGIKSLRGELQNLLSGPAHKINTTEAIGRSNAIASLTNKIDKLEKENIFPLEKEDMVAIVNDMRDQSIDTKLADEFNPENMDLLKGFNEIASGRAITERDFQKIDPYVGNEIAARLKLYSDNYNITAGTKGKPTFIQKNKSVFIPPSKLIKSFHSEKGKFRVPMPDYRNVPVRSLKSIEKFQQWIKKSNPNSDAINDLNVLTSGHFDRGLTKSELIPTIINQKTQTAKARKSVNSVLKYLEDAKLIEKSDRRGYQTDLDTLEGFLSDLGILKDFAGEKLNAKEFRKQIHELDINNLSKEGLENLNKMSEDVAVQKEIIKEIKNFRESNNVDVKISEMLELENPFYEGMVRGEHVESAEGKISIEWLNRQKESLKDQYRLENITSEKQIKAISESLEQKEAELGKGISKINNDTLEYYGYGKEKYDRVDTKNDFLDIAEKEIELYQDFFLEIIKNPENLEFKTKHPDPLSKEWLDSSHLIAATRKRFNLDENSTSGQILEVLRTREQEIDSEFRSQGKFLENFLKAKKKEAWEKNNPKTIQAKNLMGTNNNRSNDIGRLIKHIILSLDNKKGNNGRVILKKKNLTKAEIAHIEKERSIKLVDKNGNFAEISIESAIEPSSLEKGWEKLQKQYGEVIDPATKKPIDVVDAVRKNPEDFLVIAFKAQDINTAGYKQGKSRIDQQLELMRVNKKVMGKYEIMNERGEPVFKGDFIDKFGLPEGMTIGERIEQLMPYVVKRKQRQFDDKIIKVERIVKDLEDNMYKLAMTSSGEEKSMMDLHKKSFDEYNEMISKSKYRSGKEIKDTGLGRKQLEFQGYKRVEGQDVPVGTGLTEPIKKYIRAMMEVAKQKSHLDQLYRYKAITESQAFSKSESKNMYVSDFEKGFKAWKSENWLDLSANEKDHTTVNDWGWENTRNLLERDYKGEIPERGKDKEFKEKIEELYTESQVDNFIPYDQITVAELEFAIEHANATERIAKFRKPKESKEDFAMRKIEEQKNIDTQKRLWNVADKDYYKKQKDAEQGLEDEFNSATTHWDESVPSNILSIREPLSERLNIKSKSTYGENKKLILESDVWEKRRMDLVNTKDLGAIIHSTIKFDKFSKEGKLNGLTKEEYIEKLVNATADYKTKGGAIPFISEHTVPMSSKSAKGKAFFDVRRVEEYLENLQNNNDRLDPAFQLINGVPFKEFVRDNDLKFQGAQDAKIIGRTGSKAPTTDEMLLRTYKDIESQIIKEAFKGNIDNESTRTAPRGQTYEKSFYDTLRNDPLSVGKILNILKDKFPEIQVEWSKKVNMPGAEPLKEGEPGYRGIAKEYADGKVILEKLKGNRLVLEDGTVVNENEVKAFVRAVEFSESIATLDTIPHEYGHHYIDMFRNHDLVRNAVREIKKEKGLLGLDAREALVQKLGEDFASEVSKIKNKETTLDKSLGKKWFRWAYDFYDMVKSMFSSNPMKTEYEKLYDAFKQGYSPAERARMHQLEREKRGIGYERDQFKVMGFGYKNNLEEVDPLLKQEIVLPKEQVFKTDKDIPFDPKFAKKALGYTEKQIDEIYDHISTGKGSELTKKKLRDQYVSKLYQENLADKFIYSDVNGGVRADAKIKQELDYVLSKLDDLDPAMQKVFMNTHFSKFTGHTNHISNILKFIGGHENSHLYNLSFGELHEGKRTAHQINRISKHNFSNSLKEHYGGNTERAGIEYGENNIKIVDGKSTKDGEVSGKKISVDNKRNLLLTDSEIAQVYRTIKSLENNGTPVGMKPNEKGTMDNKSGQVFSIYGKETVSNRKGSDSFKLSDVEIDQLNKLVESSPEIMKLVEASKRSSEEIADHVTPIYKKLKGIDLDQLKDYITVIRETEGVPIEDLDAIVLESFFKQREVDAKSPIAIRGIMKNAVDYSVSAMRFAETKVGNHNLKQLIRVLDNHTGTSPFLEKIQDNLVPAIERLSDYYDGNSVQHDLNNPKIKHRKLIGDLKRIKEDYQNKGLSKKAEAIQKDIDKVENYKTPKEKVTALASKFMDNFPVFALGYNPFVSLKQSVSYLMASPEINKKYFSVKDFANIADVSRKGFASWLKTGGNKQLSGLDPYLSELYENSPMFQERLQGRLFKEIGETLDTSLNPITGQDLYGGIHFAGKKVKSNKFLRKTRAMEWIPIVDAATIAQIYKSSKLELENEGYNGKALVGQELIDAAIRKTEFITNKTQPTFDKLWSSSFRDSKNVLMRGLSMFGAQPHKNYNYALESLFDYYVNDRAVFKNKMLGAMSGAFILQPLALAMLGIPSLLATQAFSYDDSRTYTASLQGAVKRSLSTIPGGKVLAGLSASAMTKSWREATGIHPISSIGRDVVNVFDDSYYTKKGNAERIGKVASAMAGLPGFPIKHASSILD